MAKTPGGEEAKPKVADILSSFLQRYRTHVFVAFAVVIIGGIGAIVFFEVQSRRAEEALVRIEAAKEQYEQWQGADDETRSELEPELFAELEAIRERFSGTYGALRARYIEASIHYEAERYEEALFAFVQLADHYSDAHLAPRALLYAGFAAEELGQFGRAEELFRQIVESYGEESMEAPRALFGLARVYEAGERFEEAAEAYDQLLEDYTGSPWSDMARNRLIVLRAQERI